MIEVFAYLWLKSRNLGLGKLYLGSFGAGSLEPVGGLRRASEEIDDNFGPFDLRRYLADAD